MALILYRRHRKECEAGYPEDLRSGEFDEGRRGWKKCGCLIHASGTLGGKFARKQTGKANWEEAKAARAWEKDGAWNGPAVVNGPDVVEPPTALAPPPDAKTKSIMIERAVQAFTAELCEHAAQNTQRKYKLILAKLTAFSKSRGYVMLDQWGPIDRSRIPFVLVRQFSNRREEHEHRQNVLRVLRVERMGLA